MAPILPSIRQQPYQQQQHFKNVFWSQKRPELTLPDFQTGLSVLHQKLAQSKIENEELISYFKNRIAIEEYYALKLTDQSKTPFKTTGFGRDEGATLAKSFLQLKETSRQCGERHKATATHMAHTVLEPLQTFHEDYKQTINNSKQAMDGMLKQFDRLVKEAERSRTAYHRKCQDADKAEEIAVNNAALSVNSKNEKEGRELYSNNNNLPLHHHKDTATDRKPVMNKEEDLEKESMFIASNTAATITNTNNVANIQLGNQLMPQTELDHLVRRMRQEIPIKDHRVPILGTYKNTSTGEEIAIWLQHNLPQCKDSPAMADIVGQQLIQPYHILRLVGQRGNKFTASAHCVYQWQRSGEDTQEDEEATAVRNSSTAAASDSSSISSYGGLGGLLMDKIAPAISSASLTDAVNEEPHKKARREAEKSDQIYRAAVLKLDQTRMAIEEAMFAHLTDMQQVEFKRLQTIKSILATFTASLSETIADNKTVIDEMTVYLESLKPSQDIEYIIQQYAVSGFSPKAIVYDNYYHGIALDQVFGVSLKELAGKRQQVQQLQEQQQDPPPRFISFILAAIESGISILDDQEKKKNVWSTPCALDRVHAACSHLNTSSDYLTAQMFEKYEPDLLVAVLRYFLLELPDCLMTFEFYDPVNALFTGGYSNNEQDGDTLRVSSLSHLIASLPSSHFTTLNAILKSMLSFIKDVSASSEIIESMCHSLGPVVLRARVESFSTLNSKVPFRLMYELISHYHEIFTETTFKMQFERVKQRQAKLVVAATDIEQQPRHGDTSQNSAKRSNSSSFMSFMRPTINTSEELSNKWRNMFQKNTTSSPLSAGLSSSSSPGGGSQPSPSMVKSIPLSFGSLITGETFLSSSPPSSLKDNATVATKATTISSGDDKDNIPSPSLEQEQPTTVMFDANNHMKEEDSQPNGSQEDRFLAHNSDDNSNNNDAASSVKRPEKPNETDSSFFDDDDDEEEEEE
ncbi:hypothetical protein BDF20DRAFT_874498 [Mycotypha africana]|uniref:uncharacterized protein n=1 Tax=Mycotypha africana TaxID=64632 RepID=UPI0023012144|nr:uncharacterized protein BDF20DRAFT_874498 [Mycotypha africana]KAI8977386.1 hypothetical protein BDF20DRAFT_874498 [Mycotypha africana]